MNGSLDGTVALVTGASSGIGRATALHLADQGAAVTACARRLGRLEELVDEIEASGGTAFAVEADVTRADEAGEAVARTVERYGRLDTLVNNAGVMLLGPIQDAPLEEWERMLAVNVCELLHCTRAALPHLLTAAQIGPRRVADLVNVSSTAGRIVRNGSGVYNLTKHGVGAFSESLRQEVTERHVRVALVEPGSTVTELAGHVRPEVRERAGRRTAGIERLLPEDIAEAVGYVVTRPRRVAVNEILVRPTEQQT